MAHLLMLHGHQVGYLPPTMASEILYDNNTNVKEKIDGITSKSGTTGIDVPANASSTKVVTFDHPFPAGTSYSVQVTQSGQFAYVDVFLGSTNRTENGFTIAASSQRQQALTNLNLMWVAVPFNS